MRLPTWLHRCPVCPEMPPLADGVQARLDWFISCGQRPRIKTHALGAHGEIRDGLIEAGWSVMTDGRLMGWVVDTYAVDSTQGIIGGTKRTLEEALAYSEKELIKLRALRGKT